MSRCHAPGLLGAYRRTVYRTDGVAVRIGRRCRGMDALLVRYRASSGVFVTAWNPFSRRMPEGWNRRMQARLAMALRRWPVLPASGGDRLWQEVHLLVLGPVPPVLRLARRFRQCAVVVVRQGGAARLYYTDGPNQ